MQRLSHKQILFLADTALERLTNEASREGNDLRLVVGHANFLDALRLGRGKRKSDNEIGGV